MGTGSEKVLKSSVVPMPLAATSFPPRSALLRHPQWASLRANSLPPSNLVYMYCFLCSLVELNIFTAYILVIVCQPDVGRVLLEDWLRKCLSRLACEQNHDVEGPARYRWSHPWASGPEYSRKADCAINGEQASKQHSPWPLLQFLPVFVRQWKEVLVGYVAYGHGVLPQQ